MDRNAILNAMERKAKKIFDENEGYIQDGKRGVLVVQIRDEKNSEQWDATQRSFGITYRDYNYEDELVINNGTNFDALVHGKVAFSRRTGKNSGTNYYQVLGYESFWRGSVISDDGNCICAFSGLSGKDDQTIAQSGITCYESLKRTEKSLEDGAASEDAEDEEDGEETEEDEEET
jgi:hypothetical protein